jgi:hypothetical protein
MMIVTRRIRGAALVAALGAVTLSAPNVPAYAQAKPEGPGAEDPSKAAKRAYEGGVKAYTAGRHQNAIDQLNVALRGGGLSSSEMAKGLYYRGMSYKKINKPGLAISDLTSALWLQNGLSDGERASAEAARAEAYKAAGVAEGPTPVAVRTGAPEAPAAAAIAAPVAAAAPAPAATPAAAAPEPAAAPATSGFASIFQPAGQPAASSDGGFPQPLTMGAETAASPAPRFTGTTTASTSVNQAAALEHPTSVSSNYVSSGASSQMAPAQPVLSAAPMDQPADVSTASLPSGGGALAGVSGFFSNLFGGTSASSPTQASSAIATASTHPAPPVTPQTSSWSDSTSMSQGGAKKSAAGTAQPAAPVRTAALAPAAPPAAKVKGGKYKIHVAAVRSRSEAEALAQRLNAEHAKEFASRTATVDEATIGSMGKFYRVRVGSYPTADEPRGLCNTLRNSGYDCLVVTN